MNQSAVYASARIAAREGKFLAEEQFERLERTPDASECEKLLAEFGWGETGESGKEIGRTERERAELFRFMSETTTSPALLDCFAIREDYFNCKCAFKAKFTGNAAFFGLMSGLGTLSAERTLTEVSEGLFRDLPKPMTEAARELISEFERTGAVSPRRIDSRLDLAFFEDRSIRSRKIPERRLWRIFAVECDLVNLSGLIRARNLKVEPYFSEGGTEPAEFFYKLSSKPASELRSELRGREVYPFAERLLTGEPDVLKFEGLIREFPIRELADASEGILLQARFFYRKTAEISRVNRILTRKRNGFGATDVERGNAL